MKSASEMGRRIWPQGDAQSVSSKKSWAPSFTAAKLCKAAPVLAFASLFGLTACSRDFTLSFVYAPSETNSTEGLINAYGIDNQTGSLYPLPDSPVPSGGRKPVAIVAAPNARAVYVINHDDSEVVEFTIGTDGKLYPLNTYNTTGSYPTALALSADGKYLYVAYTYQSGFTTASPGPGGISTFAVNSDNSLGVPTDFHIGRTPVAITVSSKPTSSGANAVYVIAQDTAATSSTPQDTSTGTQNLFAFSASPTDGSLALLPGETIVSGNAPSLGYQSGTLPAGILEDATGDHLYVTDFVGNALLSYSITANGVPSETLESGSAATESGPLGMTIDPTGKYLYVANSGSGTLSGYTFGANGAPIPSTVAASTQAGTGTNCVTIEPTRGIYLYASGLISNTITGEEIIPTDGSLKPIINSPYSATTLPVCAVAVGKFR